MQKENNSSDAFTGLEAAIVLIAFVVVAAVFSYVILGAGFYTTQKAQETVYKGVEQSTTNVQLIGNVYGLTGGNTTINTIKFSINLAPGSPAVDLRGLNIIYAKQDATVLKIIQHANSSSQEASFDYYTSKINGQGDNVNSLDGTRQVEITFMVDPIEASEKINIEIRPGVGAALPFSKTAPASLTNISVLS
jgi:flagellin FlaB